MPITYIICKFYLSKKLNTLEPVHEILVIIAYAQTTSLIANGDISSRAIDILFCMSNHLYLYFIIAKRDLSCFEPLLLTSVIYNVATQKLSSFQINK